jgi:hypothetical protein
MSSKYIDGSKHGAGTAAITEHFFGSSNSEIPGSASGKSWPLGGSSAWDTQPIGSESGQQDTAPTGAPSGPSIFNDNIASPLMPRETGVNYTNRSNAGHKMTDSPFQGSANGLPGGASGAGTKLIWD